MFERRLAGKLRMREFAADFGLLPARGCDWNMDEARWRVSERLIALLPGDSRKGESCGRRNLCPELTKSPRPVRKIVSQCVDRLNWKYVLNAISLLRASLGKGWKVQNRGQKWFQKPYAKWGF